MSLVWRWPTLGARHPTCSTPNRAPATKSNSSFFAFSLSFWSQSHFLRPIISGSSSSSAGRMCASAKKSDRAPSWPLKVAPDRSRAVMNSKPSTHKVGAHFSHTALGAARSHLSRLAFRSPILCSLFHLLRMRECVRPSLMLALVVVVERSHSIE